MNKSLKTGQLRPARYTLAEMKGEAHGTEKHGKRST